MTYAASCEARLDGLLSRVRLAYPRAQVDDVEEADCGFPGFRVVLPNGIDLVVGVDIDLPEALYEVVRLYVSGEVPRYGFEHSSARGFASTGRLSSAAVLEVLHSYSALRPL
jgi:hypothetical protein